MRGDGLPVTLVLSRSKTGAHSDPGLRSVPNSHGSPSKRRSGGGARRLDSSSLRDVWGVTTPSRAAHDIRHFSARVVVTSARTLHIVVEELSGGEERLTIVQADYCRSQQ